jgi:lambda family phage portal protein
MFKTLKKFLNLRFEGGSSSYKHGISTQYNINVSPNAEYGFSRQNLIARSRSLAENNELASNALTLYCDYTIGSFITIDFTKLKGPESSIAKMKEIFDEVRESTSLDFYGKFNFDELIWNALYLALKDGDVFIRKMVDYKSPFNCSFQLLEYDQLARDVINPPKYTDGSYIDKGIRYDSQGRVIGYFFYKTHPSGENIANYGETVEIEADKIHHLSYSLKNRPAQALAMPLLTPVIVRLDQLSQYDRSQIRKQTLSGMFAMILKKSGLGGFFGNAPNSGKADAGIPPISAGKTRIDTATDGTVLELGEGFEASFPTQPKTDEYEAYHLVNGRLVAVGTHIPEPLLTNNFASVNFSSLRGAMLPFLKRTKMLRNGVVYRLLGYMFKEVIAFANVKYDLGLTKLPRPRFEAMFMFDPVKEAEALKKMLRLGVMSYKDAVAEYSNSTYEELLAERATYRQDKITNKLYDDGDPADDLGRFKTSNKNANT